MTSPELHTYIDPDWPDATTAAIRWCRCNTATTRHPAFHQGFCRLTHPDGGARVVDQGFIPKLRKLLAGRG